MASTETKTLRVINPATGQLMEECPCASARDVDAVVDVAADAFASWREDESVRREALARCAKIVSRRQNSTRLATLLTQEQGKPFKEALREVFAVSHWFATATELELKPELLREEPSHVQLLRQPLGVVAAITAWNYPLFLAACKVAPALLAGNTVVVKPSPYTPLATKLLCQLLTASSKPDQPPPLPEGVLQVLVGDDQTGRDLIGHPRVQKISFTGSTKAGVEIATQAACNLKRLTLELGGNDAAIVLEDSDVEWAADKLFWGALTNAGQFCVGIKRLYVHHRLYEPMVQRLVEIAKAVKVGNGQEPGIQMGPLSNRSQFDRVVQLVDDARRAGGQIRCGGQPLPGPGIFYPPTIVTDVAEGTALVDEEQFGPVLPVMPFSDVDETIHRANASSFGLGGSIWTSDTERGERLACRLDCGTSWVNQHGALDPHIPFGGVKLSGIGYENGHWGLEAFIQLKVINRVSR